MDKKQQTYNLTQMLEQIYIVLIEPSHPGNIGAVARAMKNMGLSKLVLVNPLVFPSSHADARASHAKDLLEQAELVADFASAVHDSHLVIGTSARNRSLPWPMVNSASCAEKICEYLVNSQNIQDNQKHSQTTEAEQTKISKSKISKSKVSIVFGREHSGLTNQELQSCNYHLFIPSSPEYSSLNLAAAVQVVCYEIYQQIIRLDIQNTAEETQQTLNTKASKKNVCKKFTWSQEPFGIDWDLPKASHEQVQRLIQHLEQTLIEVSFFDPENPKMIMQRLKRLLLRIQLDEMEVNLLRGVLTSVQQAITDKPGRAEDKTLRKKKEC